MPFSLRTPFHSHSPARPLSLALLLLLTLLLGRSQASVIFTTGDLSAEKAVSYLDFDMLAGRIRDPLPDDGEAAYNTGIFPYPYGNALLLTANYAPNGIPSIGLTLTNNTGYTINKLVFHGTRYQTRDNEVSDEFEKLVASVSGLTIPNPAVLDIRMVGNIYDSGHTYTLPPITASYDVVLDNLNFASGQSFTITWTDSDNPGNDAFFGLGNLVITASTLSPVPEPSSFLLAVLAGCTLVMTRRRRRR